MKASFNFEAVKIAIRQDKNGYVLSLSVHPNDVPDELLRSGVGQRYVVAMADYEEAASEIKAAPPVDPEPPEKPIVPGGPKLLKQAGLMCRDNRFWQWINEFGMAIVGSEEEAIQWLHDELLIDSRADLLYSQEAQDKFKPLFKLYKDFINERHADSAS